MIGLKDIDLQKFKNKIKTAADKKMAGVLGDY